MCRRSMAKPSSRSPRTRKRTMSRLRGKVAIISGSGRGIGRAVALKLAAEGASVVVNDLDEDPAAETVAAIEAAGGKAVACVGNVTAPDRSEEHTSELQSLMRTSYAAFFLNKTKNEKKNKRHTHTQQSNTSNQLYE